MTDKIDRPPEVDLFDPSLEWHYSPPANPSIREYRELEAKGLAGTTASGDRWVRVDLDPLLWADGAEPWVWVYYPRVWPPIRELDEARRAKRVRRLSFREAAKQAGRPIASVTDRPDGSRTFTFGQTTAAPDAEVNDWDNEFGAPSPPSLRQ